MADGNFMDQNEGVEVGYWEKRKAQFNGELADGINGKPTSERKAAPKPRAKAKTEKPVDRVRRSRTADKPEQKPAVRSRAVAADTKIEKELNKRYAKMPEALRKAKVASELAKAKGGK